MNRRDFIRKLFVCASAMSLSAVLISCGKEKKQRQVFNENPFPGGSGGNNDDEFIPAGGSTCNQVANQIQSNHGHFLNVPANDVSSGTQKTYNIGGSSNHSHSVSISASNMQQLAAGQLVQVQSTSSSGHSHIVLVQCFG